MTAKVDKTNVWEAQQVGLDQTVLIAAAIVVVIVVVVALILVIRHSRE